MNRCIHTRTLEGDGEKPSRHENEAPLLILLCLFYDGCKRKARIETQFRIRRHRELSEVTKDQTCVCLNMINAHT